MKTDFSKFLASAMVILFSLLVVDLCVGFLGYKSLDHLPDFTGKESTSFVKNNYRIMRLDSDIVIMGSSRANRHYNTTMLLDSIGSYLNGDYSVYNAGLDGHFITSSCLTIESMLNRYKPKMIVLDVEIEDPDLHNNKESDWTQNTIEYNALSLYCYKVEEAKKYFDEICFKDRLMLKSNMYRFNDKIFRIGEAFLKRNQKPNDGFEPIFGSTVDTVKMKINVKEEMMVEAYSENILRRIFQLCKENNVILVLVSSPRFRPQRSNEPIHSLSREYCVPYIEIYDTDFFNRHPEWFKDVSHLNNDGATVFTQMFFEELKPYLKSIKLE